jgi:ankyrin repeat protein
MHAIAADSFYIPDMLLYYGADINIRTENGLSALMVASRAGRFEIAGRLIEMGADVNEADRRGRTALHFAVMGGNKDVLELLLLSGADLEQRTTSGYSPLAAAAEMDDFEASRLLIGYGADVNSKVSRSMNPVALALRNNNTSLALMLRNNGGYDNLRPYIGQYELGTEFSIHKDFTELRFFLAIRDEKFGLRAKAGYGFWLKPAQVLVKTESDTYYQYWEKRSAVFMTVEKDLFVWHAGRRNKLELGLFAGLTSSLTFGHRPGSDTRPGTACHLGPRTGLSLSYAIGKMTLGYEYANLDLYKSSKGRFNISFSLLLNRKKGKFNTDWEL